jgi:hypothetical protein
LNSLPATRSIVIPAKAGIQYAAAFEIKRRRLGILDHPLSRMMTLETFAMTINLLRRSTDRRAAGRPV